MSSTSNYLQYSPSGTGGVPRSGRGANKITLGIFGFGCVGQGLWNVLHETKGIRAEIKKICVRDKEKERSIPSHHFTFKKNDILMDPHIDAVVELIDDPDAAFDIIKTALKNGKHAVTANKHVIAHHLPELIDLQKKYNRSLLYEGAVCGSIPIVRNLEEYYDNDLIQSVTGIFNGSTNYILTKIFEERKTYSSALRDAQKLGFAESNPDLDVKGFDPKFKLTIAIAHAYGVYVHPDDIVNLGINNLNETDIMLARDRKSTIRLVAQVVKAGDKLHALVAPQLVGHDHMLYNIRNEYNAVSVEGAFAEKQLFVGKGAGGYPTGSAVLSDISALTYNYRYEYKKQLQVQDVQFSNDIAIQALISVPFDHLDLGDVYGQLHAGPSVNGVHRRSGAVSLDTLKAWAKIPHVSVMLPAQAKFCPLSVPKLLMSKQIA